MLSGYYGFQNHIIDARPEQVHVDAHLLEVRAEGSEGPLEANIILFLVLVLHEVVILLVD